MNQPCGANPQYASGLQNSSHQPEASKHYSLEIVAAKLAHRYAVINEGDAAHSFLLLPSPVHPVLERVNGVVEALVNR